MKDLSAEYNNYDNLLLVTQALKDEREVEYSSRQEVRWRNLDPRDGIDTQRFMYRVKPKVGFEAYASYPEETIDEDVPFSLLKEGRIYLVKSKPGTSRNMKRGYVCIRRAFDLDGYSLMLHFGIYIEQNGTMVHIADPDVGNYRSVASDDCCNFINANIGITDADDYEYYVPSQLLVKSAYEILARLNYKYEDGEMKRIIIEDKKE